MNALETVFNGAFLASIFTAVITIALLVVVGPLFWVIGLPERWVELWIAISWAGSCVFIFLAWLGGAFK